MPYKRPRSPYWYTCITIGGQKTRRSTGTTNRREAERIEKAWKRAAAADSHTFEGVVAEYLAGRPNTRSAFAVKQLRAHFAGTIVQELTPADIADYKAARRAAGVADSTVHKELATLRAALRYCQHELGWIVPVDLLKGRLPKLRERGVRWLTRDEYHKLIAAAEKNKRAHWTADFIRLAVHTGLRHRELLELTWPRVDLEQRLVYLQPDDQKGARVSSIPINRTASEILERRHTANQEREAPSSYVICRTSGRRILSVKKSFRVAVQEAGIPDLRIHDLRHTCAAWLVQAGVPIRTVRDYLRHKDIATTMLYAHLAPEAVREAAAALD